MSKHTVHVTCLETLPPNRKTLRNLMSANSCLYRPIATRPGPSLKVAAVALLAVTAMAPGGTAWAAASEQEAAKLGQELTPVGAERAGNREGTIPQWSGGDIKVPPGWKPGQPRPDPYANEKRLFSIDASNVERYRDKLAPGQAEMVKTIPGYRMDVYPTHRSCGYPQFYYERTRKNATTAKLAANGYDLGEAIGAAVPFPIPQNGAEAMWNFKLNWKGEGFYVEYASYTPPKGSEGLGEPYPQEEWQASPMWSPSTNSLSDARGIESFYLSVYLGPPSVAGDATLIRHNLFKPNDIWLYFSSQRRVRRAPTYQYDAPILNSENLLIVDQYLQFNGMLDRYNWKLVGKKELYVPYNTTRLNSGANKVEDVVKTKFLSRDLVRYEPHRVWVVEATLKDGMRHTFPKRTFYLDEDTWLILVEDMYDAQGKVWRTLETGPYMAPEIPACVWMANTSYDHLMARAVHDHVIAGFKEPDYLAVREKRFNESIFEPDGLRRFTTR